ncbi:MAG: pilus assembly protein N-terminal domain-containing protein [Candidatus Sericytochromatia bacterium]|nr:pilus assembly protein N-terminal domain-containing protein [Candidatus Sericytochromatia bacterium]
MNMLMLAAAIGLSGGASPDVAATASTALPDQTGAAPQVVPHASLLRLEPGQAEVLVLPVDLRRVAVTLPGVADVTLVGRREVLVQARGEGQTSLWLWHRSGRERREVVVAARPNRSGRVEVHVQVLETRISDRQEAGVTWGSLIQGPDAQVRYEPGQATFGESTPGSSRSLGLGMVDRIAAHARAMVRDGKARLLADPRLVADSGSEATFLVGGEVPVPVAQQFGNTTMTWREYGIRLAVAPRILPDGRIRLKVAPEVSNLDQAHGLRLGTLDLPGLGSRKASTEVTLASGQALVLGGLIQEGEDEVVDRVPFLGDLPVVGALFRHRRTERQRTELTIVVTPRLVEADQP